jgi:membrane associated rhomboid family serine protease
MNDNFRERLLELEQVTPALKERYNKKVQAMLEKRLTGTDRKVWLGGTVMSVVFAVLLGALAIIPPAEEVPLPARIPVAVGVLFSVGFAIFGLRVLWRGSMDLKFDTSVIIGMVWGLAVLVVIMFTVMSLLVPDRIVGLWMMIFGLVVLVVGAVFLIRHVIEQSELKTHEKLLEIEYRIAELAETAKPGKTKP